MGSPTLAGIPPRLTAHPRQTPTRVPRATHRIAGVRARAGACLRKLFWEGPSLPFGGVSPNHIRRTRTGDLEAYVSCRQVRLALHLTPGDWQPGSQQVRVAAGYGVQASGGSAVVSRVRDDTLAEHPEAKQASHDQVNGDEVIEKARRDEDEDSHDNGDFSRDFRATPDCRSKGIDVWFGFLTGYSGPLTFDGSLELVECGIGHTHILIQLSSYGASRSLAGALVRQEGEFQQVPIA